MKSNDCCAKEASMVSKSPEGSESPPAVYWRPSRKTLTDEELRAFAERLHQRMTKLGMTQSDLARAAFGTETKDGVERAKDRDKVSLYLRGKGFPGEDKMRQLAAALGLDLAQLAPAASSSHPSQRDLFGSDRRPSRPEVQSFSVQSIGDGVSLLIVNQRLRSEDAARILGDILAASKLVSQS
jgi:transcriptional regulator with XRE-family HTH domain